jgi:CBS domain-containing protein
MPRSINEILEKVKIREIHLPEVPATAPSVPLSEVYERFEAQGRCAVVICDGDKPVGIFTERDVLNRVILERVDPATPIADLMTPSPKSVRVDECLACALRTMVKEGHRHMCLLDTDDKPVGIVSARDILVFVAEHYPRAVLNLPPDLHQRMLRCEGA